MLDTTKNKVYMTLSWRQVVALADLILGYSGEDSPKYDGRTTTALFRR